MMVQLSPIGTVHSSKKQNDTHSSFYCPARLEIKEELIPALARLAETSHIWVICLYTPKKEAALQCRPGHVDADAGVFGVLALRTPNHPNPIGLTLTKIDKIEDNLIWVSELDAYDGTAILDIKPYYEPDIIFSPRLPLIRHPQRDFREADLWRLALNYHQEPCRGAALAVKMVIAMEEMGFYIQDNELSLLAQGSPCLADTLQGLCRARLANPPRFAYEKTAPDSCRWFHRDKMIQMDVRPSVSSQPQDILKIPPFNLFYIRSEQPTNRIL